MSGEVVRSNMYDHSRKAGNRADVWKHFWLCEVVERLRPDVTGRVSVLDTHCGAGLFQRKDMESWDQGIGLFEGGAVTTLGRFGRISAPYLERNQYLGSWLLAVLVLADRRVDYEILGCDASADVGIAFERTASQSEVPSQCRFICGDGFAIAGQELRHSLVFLDPPYSPDPAEDWRTLGRLIPKLRSTTDVVAVWYPIDSSAELEQLSGICGLVRHDIHWTSSRDRQDLGMSGCGFGLLADDAFDLGAAEATACTVAKILRGRYTNHSVGGRR